MDLMEHIPKPGYHELQQQKEKDTTARNLYKSCIGIVVCREKQHSNFLQKLQKYNLIPYFLQENILNVCVLNNWMHLCI